MIDQCLKNRKKHFNTTTEFVSAIFNALHNNVQQNAEQKPLENDLQNILENDQKNTLQNDIWDFDLTLLCYIIFILNDENLDVIDLQKPLWIELRKVANDLKNKIAIMNEIKNSYSLEENFSPKDKQELSLPNPYFTLKKNKCRRSKILF